MPATQASLEDCIIRAEQLAAVQELMDDLAQQRQQVIHQLSALAQRRLASTTAAERASAAQEVAAAKARCQAIAEAWNAWWATYVQLLQESQDHRP